MPAETEAQTRRSRHYLSDDNDVRPVPDPTLLTTQQLNREVEHLQDLFVTRLEGMDKAIVLLQDIANRSPTINEVFLQHEEKFRSIEKQFVERDTRTEQTSRDSKVAVDAALQAAKEAVGEQNKSSALAIAKSEAATTKQIDQIGEIMQASNKAMDEKISDLKDRMAVMDGRKSGLSDGWGFLVGGIGVVIAIVALVIAYMGNREPATAPSKAPEIIIVPAGTPVTPSPAITK